MGILLHSNLLAKNKVCQKFWSISQINSAWICWLAVSRRQWSYEEIELSTLTDNPIYQFEKLPSKEMNLLLRDVL